MVAVVSFLCSFCASGVPGLLDVLTFEVVVVPLVACTVGVPIIVLPFACNGVLILVVLMAFIDMVLMFWPIELVIFAMKF